MVTSVDVVNAALEQIAAQTKITSLGDGSPAANAANVIYAPTVQLMLRELDPDFARTTATGANAGGTIPPPWTQEYTYPTDCLRLRQVRPPAAGSGSLADPNDPRPILYNVAVDTGLASKVILSNQTNALLVYTTSSVTEAQWDTMFYDAVVRRLANPLAMALSGRPDFAEKLLQQAEMVAAQADQVDDGQVRNP